MIITRTPFSIPLGGGGTDLPSYYSKYGGFLVSAAINKYIYITVNKRFEDSIRVSYSKTEIVYRPGWASGNEHHRRRTIRHSHDIRPR